MRKQLCWILVLSYGVFCAGSPRAEDSLPATGLPRLAASVRHAPLMIDPALKSDANWQRDWTLQNTAGVIASRQGDLIRIGNGALERVYRITPDGSLGTVRLVNKLSGQEYGSDPWPEFSLMLSGALKGERTAADFKVTGLSAGEQAGLLVVRWMLQDRRDPNLKINLTIGTAGDRKYQRKWLDVQWAGKGDLTIDLIDVEKMGLPGMAALGQPNHAGIGQPLLAQDLFLGLEYPAGDVQADHLRHFPGRVVGQGLRSKSAVWGVAKARAQVRQAFFDDYLGTLEIPPAEPFVIYNLWGAGPRTEKNGMYWIGIIDPQARRAGIRIDCYAYDAGWEDPLTIWRPGAATFPNGFAPLTAQLDGIGSHLGVWMSLFGVYGLDTRWGADQGYEVAVVGDRPTGIYCLAGPRYQAALWRTLKDYLVQNKMNYFKLDFNAYGCKNPTHGHGLGPAAREAQIDTQIQLLELIKATSPRCRTAITSGMWLSPWWTLYADWVWFGGNDRGVVGKAVNNPTPQDADTTYRDAVMYQNCIVHQYVFPNTAMMTHGFWELPTAPMIKYQDDVLMTIGRGITKWETLNTPSAMTDAHYSFMGRAMRWARKNWDVMQHTQMILGDPGQGEIYGYVHWLGGNGIVFLRNPHAAERTLELTLADLKYEPAGGAAENRSLTTRQIYPEARPVEWKATGDGKLRLPFKGGQVQCFVVYHDQAAAKKLSDF